MQELFLHADEAWEQAFHNDVMRIYRKRKVEGGYVMIKILAVIPKVPKHIVFNALADMNIRR